MWNRQPSRKRKFVLALSPALALLVSTVALAQTDAPQSAPDPIRISVDLGTRIGAYKPIYSWFGYNEANLHLIWE